MSDAFYNLAPLAKLTFAPAASPWIILPAIAAVLVMIHYLYRAQRQIASRVLVRWLTVIRILLLVLLGIVLLRPLWQWHHVEVNNETLWVVLDQSLSMGQKDPQATPIERLRWADALGFLPAEARTSRLDRDVARLTGLHGELVRLQAIRPTGADEAEASKARTEYVETLKVLGAHFTDALGRLEKDPKLASSNSGDIARSLHDAFDKYSNGVAQAAQATKGDAANAAVPWAPVGSAMQSAIAKLTTLAAQADKEFLDQHGSQQPIIDALNKVAGLRRADIAYQALLGKTRDEPKSMADVLEGQSTHVMSFAGTQQNLGMVTRGEAQATIQKGIEPAGVSTDISSALRFVEDQISQGERATVLLVSDGRVNDGGDPTDAAARLARRGVRVFTIGVGSHESAADASVDYVDAPEWIYKDDTLKASALLRFDGLSGQTAKVTVTRGDTAVDTQSISLNSNSVSSVIHFSDKPPEPGVYEYTVRVDEMPNEVVKENNFQKFRVTVKNDKLHVILVQDQPRWEDRYIANYLMRDRRVQLQQVWLEPARVAGIEAPAKVQASATSDNVQAQSLPQTAEQWSAFDLIVLGDVPTEFLPVETQRNIAKAVRDRGATLMVVAGQLNMPARYVGSPLAEMLPVHLSSAWSAAALQDHARKGFRPELAPEGINTVFSNLDLDETKNSKYWTAMGLEDNKWFWHSEQTQAKQSASVYWQIGELKPANAPASGDSLTSARARALLCSMPVGLGRTLYLSSEQTWRMRQVDGANLHERFWGQVVRWVVQNDLPAGGRFVRFGTSKPRYLIGDSVVVNIRLMNPDFTPMLGQTFKVVAKGVAAKDSASGQVQGGAVIATAEAVAAPESPGMYRATLSGLAPGGIELSLQGDNVEKILNGDPNAAQKTLLTDILSGSDREMRNVNADPKQIARIAQAGGGISSEIAYADVLAQHIPNLQLPQEITHQIGLFANPDNPYTRKAHWAFLILFVTLITTEWILRKAGGLV